MRGLVGNNLDHYQILAEVGQGGMATVYRAQNQQTGEEVALKVLSPTIAGDKRFIRRFRREGGLLARMSHPNIVPVFDYGESHGFVYLAMPFVHGQTLTQHLKNEKLQLADIIGWIQQVADALAYAHSQGVIHRDVKPSNIIIDDNNKARLTDFGLAREAEASNTLTGSMLLGTPAYMSPEQAAGKPVTAASDQYSLGIILYQVFTGRLPFDEEAPMATVMMHINEPVPRPSRFNAALPDSVERVILKSLAKNPAFRYESVAALDQAFRAALNRGTEEPTQVMHPASVPEVPSRAASGEVVRQRRPVYLWILFPFLLAAVIGAVWLLQQNESTAAPAPQEEVPLVFESPAAEDQAAASGESTSAAAVVTPDTLTVQPAALPTAVQSDSCPGLSLFNFKRDGSAVSWSVDNSLDHTVQLVNADFQIPESNWLVQLTLSQQVLLEMDPFATPDPNTVLQIPGDERTQIPAGKTVTLELRYAVSDPLPGYAVVLHFDESCTLSTDW